MPRQLRITTNEWVDRSNVIHNFRYDYSEAIYLGSFEYVRIICPEHGLFEQKAINHLQGYGCRECAGNAKLTNESFADRANEIYDNKYDYSLVDIKGGNDRIIIICPDHGEFLQVPRKHFLYGCAECAGVNRSNTEEFKEKAILVHGNQYDYSECVYISCMKKVKIICKEHGEFYQSPNSHLKGNGCKYCSLGNSSQKEQLWLDYMGIPNDNDHRNVRIEIEGKRFYIDGLFKKEKVAYEFLGDFGMDIL